MKCKKLSKVMSLALAVVCAVGVVNPMSVSAATNKTDTTKKYSNVGTTITSTSRTADNIVKVKVKLSLPKGKTLEVTNVKKKANKSKIFVKNKITVHFASSKAKLKSSPIIKSATVKKTGSNTLEFTLKNKELESLKTVYMSARFKADSKLAVQDTNFASVVKVTHAKGYKYVYDEFTEVSGNRAGNEKDVARDKDGTYASAIHKRFNWDYKGCKVTSCGETLGTWDDGDGWIYVTAQASRCDGCGKTSFCFVSENWYSRDCTVHSSCNGGSWGTIVTIAFDKKTGKVVHGSPEALKKYPIGTFFMDVD